MSESKDVALNQTTKRKVMGDVDRNEFHFNVPLSDDELLTMLEDNAYIDILCNWMVNEALKNGFELKDKSPVNFIIQEKIDEAGNVTPKNEFSVNGAFKQGSGHQRARKC